MLGDPGWSVKRAAVSALADMPTPESQRALERFGSREEDLHLKRFAAWALNRVRERSGVFRSMLDSVRKAKR
jgi:HEAT repeat protein